MQQVRDKPQIELTARLADILDLRRQASAEQIAARVAAFDDKPPPRRLDTCELLAAVALLGEDLIDNFRGINNPDLLLIGSAAGEVAEELLEQLGPISERELAEDLALTDAEFLGDVQGYVANHPALAVQEHLDSLLDNIIYHAYLRGWLRRDPPPSPREVALKKLAKRRAKLAKRRGQKP